MYPGWWKLKTKNVNLVIHHSIWVFVTDDHEQGYYSLQF